MEGLTEDLARSLPPNYPRVTFVDASAEAGIQFTHFSGSRSVQLPEDMGSGAAWGDYDNDGWLDLYVVNEIGPLTLSPAERLASPAHNKLYRNLGDGTFQDVTQVAGVGYGGCGQAVAWGDYDNDGWLDLIVTNYGRNLLYRNLGDGTFEDVSTETGIGREEGFWSGASWADYDLDGDLDLYICGYVYYRYESELMKSSTRLYNALMPSSLNPSTYKPSRNLLYQNTGKGAFKEVAAAAGVQNTKGRSLSAAWCDFDGDGWTDLYVANDVSDNVMYRNKGDGTFDDVSHAAWVADYRGAMGLAVGDWDRDGDIDLFVTHWLAQENALYNNMEREFKEVDLEAGSQLRFTDVADQHGLGQIALDYIGWGTALFDYDNDGRLDLLISNGSTFQEEEDPSLLVPMKMLLFWNAGPEKGFYDVSPVSGQVLMNPIVGRGLAVADYDNDGDLDAFVVANGGRAILLRNEPESPGNWLKVRLAGAGKNRFGVGATLRVVADSLTIIRQVGASSSYYSQHAVGEELFGLGRTAQVDTLEAQWPGRGVQRLTNLSVNQTLTLDGTPQKGTGK